jgi:hypothetical protein
MTAEIKIHFQKNIMHISMNIMTGSGHIALEHHLEIPADEGSIKNLAQCTLGTMHTFMKYALL